jgi:hypothetical protein
MSTLLFHTKDQHTSLTPTFPCPSPAYLLQLLLCCLQLRPERMCLCCCCVCCPPQLLQLLQVRQDLLQISQLLLQVSDLHRSKIRGGGGMCGLEVGLGVDDAQRLEVLVWYLYVCVVLVVVGW